MSLRDVLFRLAGFMTDPTTGDLVYEIPELGLRFPLNRDGWHYFRSTVEDWMKWAADSLDETLLKALASHATHAAEEFAKRLDLGEGEFNSIVEKFVYLYRKGAERIARARETMPPSVVQSIQVPQPYFPSQGPPQRVDVSVIEKPLPNLQVLPAGRIRWGLILGAAAAGLGIGIYLSGRKKT